MNAMQNRIVENLRIASANQHATYQRRVAFHLATLILAQKHFNDLTTLRAFCADPDNLRTWLPSDIDRANLSAELATSLSTIATC